MKRVTALAYAKINTYLDVVGRRENGYHNIESIMQTVSLCDKITVTVTGEGDSVTLTCSDPRLPTDEKNLAYKAARRFMDSVGVFRDLAIDIEKNIPFEAGLGGGSSDAAAVIRALDLLLATELPESRLTEIGSRIGADVPFCIVGGTAAVTGVGERVEELDFACPYYVVVAIDGEGVSTPYAFGLLDGLNRDYECYRTPKDFCAVKRAYTESDYEALCRLAYNSFEEVILPARPRAKALKEELLRCCADASILSGSGPSVIALFRDRAMAELAADKVRGMGARAWVCHTVGAADTRQS